MTRHFPIIIEQDIEGYYIVECPSFVGCRSYGKTMDEAIENIREAIELCLEDESQEISQENVFVGVRDIELAI
jgi:predicted RNase H-like HicB family nuclease